ncbi:hypothetical protein K8R33_03550 [archaeon]|nr:hypothetical protein [archaeon]
MMDARNEALAFVMKNGPVLPSQISTTINTNILFASAILSELVDKKKVKLTYIKRGGSPFYYVSGQEEKLMDLAQFLSGKVKEAYDLISEKIVIRDSEALPWQRVALRDLKDFAVPLTVNHSGKAETFWKWYLTANDDAKVLIKKLLGDFKSEAKEEPKKVEKPIERQEILEKPVKEEIKQDNDVFDLILDYFKENEMYVISQNIARKGREFNFVIDVPSNLGQLRYFVKFKNKKNITDSDLLSALDEAGKSNLPVLFLGNGELNKKAQKYLDENVSGQMIFRKV